jgi:hypothetical protein
MTKATKPKKKAKKRPSSLGARKAAPMPFKDVVQKLLETPPEPKTGSRGRKAT